MDTAILVEDQIEDGQRLLLQLVRQDIDVAGACWVKDSEEGRSYLYIASDLVDSQGLTGAYRDVYSILSSMESLSISPLEVKLISPRDPVARDFLEIRDRYPARLITRTRRPRLGNLNIEEAVIYPRVQPFVKGFDELKQQYPSAEIYSVTIPCPDPAALVQKLHEYTGKVNEREFEGKAPGTLLCMGSEGSNTKSTAQLVFVYRPEGWNKLYRRETQTWEDVILSGSGKPPYESVDFSPLADLKNADSTGLQV